VNRFYDEYYFRPKVVWRIVKEALWTATNESAFTTKQQNFCNCAPSA